MMIPAGWLVIGFGVSGRSTAKLLARKRIPFYVTDKNKDVLSQDDILWLKSVNAGFCSEQQALGLIKSGAVDCLIASSGIPAGNVLLKAGNVEHIPVWGELEFAVQFLQGKKIGVTGTNGKTTTVYMLYHILKQARYSVLAGGNVGIAAADLVTDSDVGADRVFVLELSSYQLEQSERLELDAGIITNISPDHCDRYDDFEAYARVKLKMVDRIRDGGFFICRSCDVGSYQSVAGTECFRGKQTYFIGDNNTASFFADSEGLWFSEGRARNLVIRFDEAKFLGEYMMMNAAMAGQVAYLMGVGKDDIIRAIRSFEGLEHRLEFVDQINGVRFYNDSKATNPDAVVNALNTFSNPVILIMGGQDKGAGLEELKSIIAKKVKIIILIGESTDQYEKMFCQVARIFKSRTMNDAVRCAYKNACQGDVVLLSPACASFDMFKNFEERGTVFKNCVKNLLTVKMFRN